MIMTNKLPTHCKKWQKWPFGRSLKDLPNGHFLQCCYFLIVFALLVCLLLLFFFFAYNPPTRRSSCRRSRAPGWRDHCSFQPYPWLIQAWNFLCSSNIWLYHILQIGIKIDEREKHISAHARDSRDTGTQKITAKTFHWSFNSEQTAAAS